MKRTGAQILWECLVREGVSTVFGYPGGAILPAYDAMLDYPIRHVLVRHEQGATHMADGYARATGKVGVAIATSGPGRDQHGHRHRHRDDGLVADRLHHRAGRQQADRHRRLPGDRHHRHHAAGHQAQLPGHPRAGRRARRSARRSTSPRAGRPGPVLIDITKDAQQASCEFDWDAAAPRPHARPERVLDQAALVGGARADQQRQAADDPGRPRHHRSRAPPRSSGTSPSARRFPVALTLLGIGGIPASHPLNLGMMGMHGEAWVNTAIQEADLLLAFGMRFDDRVTGNLKTYAPNAKKIHIDIDPAEINKNVKVDVGLVGDLRTMLEALLPGVGRGPPARVAGPDRRARRATPRSATSRTCRTTGTSTPRTSSTTSGAPPQGRRDRRHRRRPAPDVGGAVLPPRRAALADHLGRPRHDGLRAAGGDRRQDGLPGRGSLGRSSATAASR